MTCDGVKWPWTQEEESSFECLKVTLSTKTTLGFVDPKKSTSIFVDGNSACRGALTQREDTTALCHCKKELLTLLMKTTQLLSEQRCSYEVYRVHVDNLNMEAKQFSGTSITRLNILKENGTFRVAENNANLSEAVKIPGWL